MDHTSANDMTRDDDTTKGTEAPDPQKSDLGRPDAPKETATEPAAPGDAHRTNA